MRPELPLASTRPVDGARMVATAQAHLHKAAAGSQFWSIELRGGRAQRATLDAVTGEAVAAQNVRQTGGGQLLCRMHCELHYMPYDVAIRLVGICSMFMLVAILRGIVTHKKVFTDFFTFRPGKGQRSWLDAHNLVSVSSLLFFLMITYSGLVFFMYEYMPEGRDAAYGVAQSRQQYLAELSPGNRVLPTRQPAALAPLADALRATEQEWGAGRVA